MLTNIGRESEYSQEDLKPLTVKEDAHGNIVLYPEVQSGWQVVCAYNQFGVKNLAKLYVCESLEDMNKLVKQCHQGDAIYLEWRQISDTSIRMKYNDAAAFFKRKQPSYASMIEKTLTEDKLRNWH